MSHRSVGGCLAAVLALVLAAPAQASFVQTMGGLHSATNGIALGPDGNVWVVEEGAGSVAKVSPSGQVLAHIPVGTDPQGLTVGPDNNIWVAVTGSRKVTGINPTTGAIVRDITTPWQDGTLCPPTNITSGAGKLYFTMPKNDASCTAQRLGSMDATGASFVASGQFGRATDVVVVGPNVWVTDNGNDRIDRTDVGLTNVDLRLQAADKSRPTGIAADRNGNVWVTLEATGQVVKVPPGLPPSPSTPVPAPFTPSVALSNPDGIVAGTDGNVYVAGQTNVQRVSQAGHFTVLPTPGSSSPRRIITAPGGDLWASDSALPDVLRIIDRAPSATTGAPAALSPNSASFSASVDTGGNETAVVFDFGATTAYGTTTPPITVNPGAAASTVSTSVSGLPAGTTLHVRVRATNALGGATGGDMTVTTPVGVVVVDNDHDGVSPPLDCDDNNAAIHPGAFDIPGDAINQDCVDGPAPFPLLAATPSFSWNFVRKRTVLTRMQVKQLQGGEAIKLSCRGSGCPFRSRTTKRARKGTATFTKLFKKRRFAKGAKLTIRVTKAQSIGRLYVITFKKSGTDPTLSTSCLAPGRKKPQRCRSG